jgi:tellurite resistance-related uncharacterized protein
VLDDALDTDQADASNAEVPHQLLVVHRTKVGVLHHLLVLVGELERKVVLG